MSGLFSNKAPPAPAKEPVMPLPDDEAVKLAKMKSYAGKQRKSGRLSTILTENDTLGGN